MENIFGKLIYRAARALASLLIPRGVKFKAFIDVARRAWIDESVKIIKESGEESTKSMVSLMTGLDRRTMVLEQKGWPDPRPSYEQMTLSRWRKDPDYSEKLNCVRKPRELSKLEFENLCKTYGGNIPYQTILKSLEKSSCVEFEGDKIRYLRSDFIPHDQDKKIHYTSETIQNLTETICHNLSTDDINKSLRRYQQSVTSFNIPKDLLAEFKKMLSEKITEHVNDNARMMEEFEVKHNIEGKRAIKKPGTYLAGFSTFYFERQWDVDPH